MYLSILSLSQFQLSRHAFLLNQTHRRGMEEEDVFSFSGGVERSGSWSLGGEIVNVMMKVLPPPGVVISFVFSICFNLGGVLLFVPEELNSVVVCNLLEYLGLADEPLLLSVKDAKTDYAKQKPVFVTLIKWVLKFIMWVIFISWVTFIFLYPAEFVQGFSQSWIQSTSGTVFGITGSVFLIFSVPVLILVFLSIAYLIASPSEDFLVSKKNLKDPRFRLWTFPILVDGPFGVVSVAELIGIIFVIVYILWAVSAYTIQNYDLVSKFNLPFMEESSLILELSGLRFGSIGLFCLSFLFLPITRGSFLLRLIDLPFEHATRYHVWLGHLTMLVFTLHGIFYIVAWTMQGRLLQEMLQWRDIGVANFPGVISLLAGVLMWVTSLHPVRKQYFELFFYTHQLYVVFIVFLALHVGDFIFSIAAGGIFLFLLDRFLRFCQSRKTVNIISATCLPCGTVELILSKPRNLRYNALSFIFLQVRELSWLQWHPFSVSSSPLDGRHHLSVLIKVLGEWTRSLRDTISKDPEEPQKQLAVTASVEGPYGHESAYHLMYENLILVAGGIGISPFLAILSDIFHRIEERKPCLPKSILVVWAVKKSVELSLLSAVDLVSICPSFSNKLHLEILVYVTQELEPPLEDGIVCKSVDHSYFPVTNGCNMSDLVGTGNNIWSGIYVVTSTIGFITFLALMDIFYIKPFGITTWWFRGLLFVACMIAGVIIFGGLVVVLWHLWERRDSDYEKCIEEDKNCDPEQRTNRMTHPSAYQTALASLTMTQYGARPDFREIFHCISESWGEVDDVGVIVCGPPTLQSSVAKACRSQNLMGRQKNHHHQQQPFFHFNSHSFDL